MLEDAPPVLDKVTEPIVAEPVEDTYTTLVSEEDAVKSEVIDSVELTVLVAEIEE